MYMELSTKATAAGDYINAGVLSRIASEESNHHALIGIMINSMDAKIREAELGTELAGVGPYRWVVHNWAVGEKHETTAEYSSKPYVMSSAHHFIESELCVGHPEPDERGYEIKVLDSTGNEVYSEWYTPYWLKARRGY